MGKQITETELLDKLKKALINFGELQDNPDFFGRKNSKTEKRQKYYVSDLKYNLYKKVVPKCKLGKDSDAIKSSAAMIYNTIYTGDIIIDNKQFKGFSKENFYIYELPFAAIKDDNGSIHSAQLDAGLISADSQGLILLEAKCMEWLSSPKGLKKAYLNKKNYIHEEAAQFFTSIFNQLVYEDKFKTENGKKVHKPKKYSRYDAVQMMIHCLGIYNWCLEKYKNSEENFKTIRLINLVWDCKESKKYVEEEDEGKKFANFANSELKEKFKKLGVDFFVEYFPYSDFFNNRVDWHNDMEHQKYLRPYKV